ncbi:hypothetical protein [Stutzerimonas stutzeri]|uniref:Uncharacterized protein n=1 Tax=Stutzerimonas stutzeri TaxID=316 RepID=A0A6I6LWB9_STUST|nr:hypothetical protein [Stutzerimonas stutzeri]QGZ30671.1 hypothetical protein GQA94_11570 [Stutzerimonas stutzeri]
MAWTLLVLWQAREKARLDGPAFPQQEDVPMDDYQDEILEWHAAEQDSPEPAEDAFEL